MAKKIELAPEIVDLATLSKAMSHPVRVFILKKLSGMNSCCYSGNLVDELPIGRSALSQHLKELKFAGLIQGKIEPPYIKYCLNRENFNKAKQLYQAFFEQNMS